MRSGPSTCSRVSLLLVLAGLLAPALAETGPWPATPSWRPFRSEAGRFRVELPSVPRVERSTHGTAMGSVTEVSFHAGWGDREVAVVYEDIPTAARWLVPAGVILGRAASSLVEDAGGREIESLESSWRGRPARELHYALPRAAPRQARARLILVEARLYLLVARWPLGAAMPPELKRFRASFEVEGP